MQQIVYLMHGSSSPVSSINGKGYRIVHYNDGYRLESYVGGVLYYGILVYKEYNIDIKMKWIAKSDNKIQDIYYLSLRDFEGFIYDDSNPVECYLYDIYNRFPFLQDGIVILCELNGYVFVSNNDTDILVSDSLSVSYKYNHYEKRFDSSISGEIFIKKEFCARYFGDKIVNGLYTGIILLLEDIYITLDLSQASYSYSDIVSFSPKTQSNIENIIAANKDKDVNISRAFHSNSYSSPNSPVVQIYASLPSSDRVTGSKMNGPSQDPNFISTSCIIHKDFSYEVKATPMRMICRSVNRVNFASPGIGNIHNTEEGIYVRPYDMGEWQTTYKRLMSKRSLNPSDNHEHELYYNDVGATSTFYYNRILADDAQSELGNCADNTSTYTYGQDDENPTYCSTGHNGFVYQVKWHYKNIEYEFAFEDDSEETPHQDINGEDMWCRFTLQEINWSDTERPKISTGVLFFSETKTGRTGYWCLVSENMKPCKWERGTLSGYFHVEAGDLNKLNPKNSKTIKKGTLGWLKDTDTVESACTFWVFAFYIRLLSAVPFVLPAWREKSNIINAFKIDKTTQSDEGDKYVDNGSNGSRTDDGLSSKRPFGPKRMHTIDNIGVVKPKVKAKRAKIPMIPGPEWIEADWTKGMTDPTPPSDSGTCAFKYVGPFPFTVTGTDGVVNQHFQRNYLVISTNRRKDRDGHITFLPPQNATDSFLPVYESLWLTCSFWARKHKAPDGGSLIMQYNNPDGSPDCTQEMFDKRQDYYYYNSLAKLCGGCANSVYAATSNDILSFFSFVDTGGMDNYFSIIDYHSLASSGRSDVVNVSYQYLKDTLKNLSSHNLHEELNHMSVTVSFREHTNFDYETPIRSELKGIDIASDSKREPNLEYLLTKRTISDYPEKLDQSKASYEATGAHDMYNKEVTSKYINTNIIEAQLGIADSHPVVGETSITPIPFIIISGYAIITDIGMKYIKNTGTTPFTVFIYRYSQDTISNITHDTEVDEDGNETIITTYDYRSAAKLYELSQLINSGEHIDTSMTLFIRVPYDMVNNLEIVKNTDNTISYIKNIEFPFIMNGEDFIMKKDQDIEIFMRTAEVYNSDDNIYKIYYDGDMATEIKNKLNETYCSKKILSINKQDDDLFYFGKEYTE